MWEKVAAIFQVTTIEDRKFQEILNFQREKFRIEKRKQAQKTHVVRSMFLANGSKYSFGGTKLNVLANL
jgi:hypothetical protein